MVRSNPGVEKVVPRPGQRERTPPRPSHRAAWPWFSEAISEPLHFLLLLLRAPSWPTSDTHGVDERTNRRASFLFVAKLLDKVLEMGRGENTLRGKIHISKRTLRWMLRKPSLTFQLPYTQLNKRPPCPPHCTPWAGRSLGVML